MPARHEESRILGAGGSSLAYQLRRSPRRRTLALRVNDAGDVLVNAPMRLALRDIEAFIQRHRPWIEERQRVAATHVFVWQDGAQLPWLGETLALRLHEASGRPVVRREDGRLVCHAPVASLAALVERWYRQEARTLLGERLRLQADRAGLALPPLRISNARTRWGRLSPTGVVSLNWRLLKAPLEIVDYVICHELAHFRQRNHSPAFWHEVGLLYPDWQRARGELRRHGRGYFQF
jgi:predicted metal-dependent hydrolase